MKRSIPALFVWMILLVPSYGADLTSAPDALYGGWLKMYDLRFDEAHRIIGDWQKSHPANPLGPVSQATGYLFSELARLGVLESELFVDDHAFEHRKRLQADPATKTRFTEQVDAADREASAALEKSATDRDALLAKTLELGLRSDYAALIEKQSLAALSYTKQSRVYAERLLQSDPQAYDAYLGPGVENYLLSLKALPLRFILQMTGSRTDREKGIEQLRLTAAHGHYLEPFAKLLLAVAALREKNSSQAQSLLQELHDRFPENPLYLRELSRLATGTK